MCSLDSYLYILNVGNHLSSSITSFDRYVAIVLFGFRGLNTDIQHLDEQIYGLLVVSRLDGARRIRDACCIIWTSSGIQLNSGHWGVERLKEKIRSFTSNSDYDESK